MTHLNRGIGFLFGSQIKVVNNLFYTFLQYFMFSVFSVYTIRRKAK